MMDKRTFTKLAGISAAFVLFPSLARSQQLSAPSPLGRFLLVASEGLYVVERDGSCSWSYEPAPNRKPMTGMEADIIYDGSPLPNGNFLLSTHQYLREVDRNKRTVWEYR